MPGNQHLIMSPDLGSAGTKHESRICCAACLRDTMKKPVRGQAFLCLKGASLAQGLEYFQFEMLRISNHTACRFAEKARFCRSLRAGRRCAAAPRFTLRHP